MTDSRRCPEPQVLHAFVEGRAGAAERQAVLAHLVDCETCMSAVDLANEIHREETPPASSRGWWQIAAAVLLVAAGLAAWRLQTRRSATSMATLVAAAPRDARPVEPRLSGGFAWAAYVGPNRSSSPSADEKTLELSGLAGQALAEARRSGTAPAQHVAGVAMLMAGRGDASIALLEAATRRAPGDAHAWNDLAAAQYTLAADQPSRYTSALAAADRALRIDAGFAEALFNRALILEHLGLAAEARRAWQRFLDVDATSPWASEARERLAKLVPANAAQQFEREQPRLESAAANGDVPAVVAIVRAHHERARTWGEAEYLGRWAEAEIAHEDARAVRNLAIARALGNALADTTGETLLRDAVAAIDTADAATRAALARAHATYRRGRIAYARHLLTEAEPLLREAAAEFGRSPMAGVARYYAANTHFDQADVATARAELEQLLGETERTPGYIALGAQVRWELALCHNAVDDWPGALPLLTDAAGRFRRLGERSNLGMIETLLADTLAACGRPDEAAAARIRSFALASRDERGNRLPVSVAVAATSELSTGHRDAARALLAVARDAARDAGDDALSVDLLMQSALLEAEAGDGEDARRDAADAEAAATRLADPSLRERATAQARLAGAAAALDVSPSRARTLAASAVAFFANRGFTVHLPLAYLLSARASLALGLRDEASRDLERGLAALEEHPIGLSADLATPPVLDANDGLFEAAMSLALARDDRAAAFDLVQRAQMRSRAGRVTAAQLQRQLGDTTVLAMAVIGPRLVSCAVTARELAVAERTIDREHLGEVLARAATLDDDAALRELHALLIAPSEAAIAGARRLIVVPDRVLDPVPFAALLDGASRPLVARVPVATALSVGSLSNVPRAEQPHLVTIALPSGRAAATASLPETSEEVEDAAALYRRADVVPPTSTFAGFARAAAQADVIHIAGHATRSAGNDTNALLFAGGEAVTWRRAAAVPCDRAVVVLAACETLRRPRSSRARTLSLGAAFLGSGAADVVGTLAPISDRAARVLFGAVHRELARGADAASAVRDAQLAAMQAAELPPAQWRAIAVLTQRIR